MTSPVSLRGEAEAISQLATDKEKAKNIRPGAKPYEILVKRGASGSFEEGDIIMIKPAGFLWGQQAARGKEAAEGEPALDTSEIVDKSKE